MHRSFISFTRRELNTPTLLRTFSRLITFCLDAVYWGNWTFVFLSVNTSNLSDGDIMLIDSSGFPGFPWPRSTNTRGTKGNNIGNDYIRDADVRGTYTGNTGAVKCLEMHS